MTVEFPHRNAASGSVDPPNTGESSCKAVKLVEQAIELVPSHSHAHGRHAIKHLQTSKQHFQTALQHWENGNPQQALDGLMLGRDYAEASILHARCKDFLCR